MSHEIQPERMAKIDGRQRGRAGVIGCIDSQIEAAEFKGDHDRARRLKMLRLDLEATPALLAATGLKVTDVTNYINESEAKGDHATALYWRRVRANQAANA